MISNRLLNLSRILLNIIFIGGISIFLTLPFCLRKYLEFTNLYSLENYINIMLLLYITGIFTLGIVYLLTKMFKNISNNKPFIYDNVKILNNIGRFSMIVACIYFIGIFVIKSFFVIIIFMIFVIISLMSFALSGLFDNAILYKEENDLTI